METSPCHNSVAGHQIATIFCIRHDSTAVGPCTKFCGDHLLESRWEWNEISIDFELRWKKNLSETGSRINLWINPTRDPFRQQFSITIPMLWKFHFALIQILIELSLQNFTCGTTAVLSRHVKNCAMASSNWFTAKWHIHRIWIVMEKSWMKWVQTITNNWWRTLETSGCPIMGWIVEESFGYTNIPHTLTWIIRTSQFTLPNAKVHTCGLLIFC